MKSSNLFFNSSLSFNSLLMSNSFFKFLYIIDNFPFVSVAFLFSSILSFFFCSLSFAFRAVFIFINAASRYFSYSVIFSPNSFNFSRSKFHNLFFSTLIFLILIPCLAAKYKGPNVGYVTNFIAGNDNSTGSIGNILRPLIKFS